MTDKPVRGAFLLTLEMAEKLYSVPVEQREALLAQMVKDHNAQFLGVTDKTEPELAIDCIKAGIRAKSYVSKKSLTKLNESDKIVIEKQEELLQKKPPA